MRVTRGIPAATDTPAALTIGNFDGVHLGHQAMLAELKRAAARLRVPACVPIFEPHPREFFQPDKPHFRLTPLPRKLALLEEFGLDVAVVVRFDAALAGLTAEAFIERVLAQGLGVRHVVVGYDFRFGKGRTGDPETLRRLYSTAIRAGATRVCIADTVGHATPAGAAPLPTDRVARCRC